MTIVDESLADLRAELAEYGEEITIRRYTGKTVPRPKVEAKVRGRVKGLGSSESLVGAGGGGSQSKFSVVAINDPAATVESGFVALSAMLPLQAGDKVVIAGRELTIQDPDEFTRRVAGTTIGVNMTAIG